jgi:hypothetical protein
MLRDWLWLLGESLVGSPTSPTRWDASREVENGEADGTVDALAVIVACTAVPAPRRRPPSEPRRRPVALDVGQGGQIAVPLQ